jgi:hypothetical protein
MKSHTMQNQIAVEQARDKGFGVLTLMQNILNGWSATMTDEDKKEERLHIGVDGGFNISKQAVWRTFVLIAGMFTGGIGVSTKLENIGLHQQIADIRVETKTITDASTKKQEANTEEVNRIKNIINVDVLDFLINEKAQQKTKAAADRYQRQIQNIRDKLTRPIGKMDEPIATPNAPVEFREGR